MFVCLGLAIDFFGKLQILTFFKSFLRTIWGNKCGLNHHNDLNLLTCLMEKQMCLMQLLVCRTYMQCALQTNDSIVASHRRPGQM